MLGTAERQHPTMIRLDRIGRDAERRDRAKMTGKARAGKTVGRRIVIDISEPSAEWRALRRRRAICDAAARAALAAALDGRWANLPFELSIVLGDDLLLRRLNRRWRGIDRSTNVLSFPAQEAAALAAIASAHPGAPRRRVPQTAAPPLPLGDVILAFRTIADEAAAQGKTLADHLAHLVVHGVFHLLGLDHEDPGAAARMEALEAEVLAGFGIADPYMTPASPRQAQYG
jgi:probable rRNA maturation factor